MSKNDFSREEIETLIGEVSAQGCLLLHIVRMFNGNNDDLDFKKETLDFVATLETYNREKHALGDARFPLSRVQGAKKICELVRNNLER